MSAKAFEKFIRNGASQDFVDLNGQEFPFDTVFQITPYSYRCCPCAFEHEYFDYLSKDGIDEDMLNRVLQSIESGRCPHVDDNLTWQYTRRTGQYLKICGLVVLKVPVNNFIMSGRATSVCFVCINQSHG